MVEQLITPWYALDTRTVREENDVVTVEFPGQLIPAYKFQAGNAVAVVRQVSRPIDNNNVRIGIVKSVKPGSSGNAMLNIEIWKPVYTVWKPVYPVADERRGKQVTAGLTSSGKLFIRKLGMVLGREPSLSVNITRGLLGSDRQVTFGGASASDATVPGDAAGATGGADATEAVNFGTDNNLNGTGQVRPVLLDADGNGNVDEAEYWRFADEFGTGKVPMRFGEFAMTVPENMQVANVTYDRGGAFEESFVSSGTPVSVSKSRNGDRTYVDIIDRLDSNGIHFGGGPLVNAQPKVHMQMLATLFEAIRARINGKPVDLVTGGEANNVGVDVIGISPTTVCNGDSYIGSIIDNNGNPFGFSALTKVSITSSIGVTFYYNSIQEFPLFTEQPVSTSTSVTSFTITIRGEYNGTSFNHTFPISITQCSQDVVSNDTMIGGVGNDTMIGGADNDTMICGDGDELDSLVFMTDGNGDEIDSITLMTGEVIGNLYAADAALVPDSNAAVTASEAQITSGFGGGGFGADAVAPGALGTAGPEAVPVPVYEVTSGAGGSMLEGGGFGTAAPRVELGPVVVPVVTSGAQEQPIERLELIDMDKGVEILSNKMIEKVVRIKRSGKCGYRIVLKNVSGLIDSVRCGRYDNCILVNDRWVAGISGISGRPIPAVEEAAAQVNMGGQVNMGVPEAAADEARVEEAHAEFVDMGAEAAAGAEGELEEAKLAGKDDGVFPEQDVY